MSPDYVTQDLVTACYLACCGFEPEVQQVSAGRVEFVFKRSAELDDALRAFRTGEARVPPAAFHTCQIELRRRMDAALGRRSRSSSNES